MALTKVRAIGYLALDLQLAISFRHLVYCLYDLFPMCVIFSLVDEWAGLMGHLASPA